MKRLAIIWDSMTGGSKALAFAVADGAQQTGAIVVQVIAARDADALDVQVYDGYIFVFPENLAAISGVMKSFFDRSYYPCLGQIEGRPYAVIVCAGSDGRNAAQQVDRIAKGWRLRKIADSFIVCTNAQTPDAILATKVISLSDLKIAMNIGAAMAEGLALGLF